MGSHPTCASVYYKRYAFLRAIQGGDSYRKNDLRCSISRPSGRDRICGVPGLNLRWVPQHRSDVRPTFIAVPFACTDGAPHHALAPVDEGSRGQSADQGGRGRNLVSRCGLRLRRANEYREQEACQANGVPYSGRHGCLCLFRSNPGRQVSPCYVHAGISRCLRNSSRVCG